MHVNEPLWCSAPLFVTKQIRGATRLEVERINDKCVWKTPGWNSTGKIYSYRLEEEEGCYGELVGASLFSLLSPLPSVLAHSSYYVLAVRQFSALRAPPR